MSARGQIKWFNNETGWGFIACKGSDDILIRHDQIDGNGFKTLYVGDRVEFEVKQGPNGLFAMDVRVLSSKNSVSRRAVS